MPEPLGPTMAMRLADIELEAEIVEHRRLAAFVLEGDAVEGDVVGDARQVGRAGTVGAAGRLVQQFLDVADRRRRLDRHRDEVHHVGDVVGDLPERALEGDEGADGDLALGREIGADREHHEVQQQHRDGDRALHHGRQEHRGSDLAARVSSLRSVNQPNVRRCRLNALITACAATFSCTMPSSAALVQLLLVIGLHRLRRQDARPDQRDREHQQRDRGELPVQEQHQDDAGDQFQERQRRAVGEGLDRALEGRQVDGKARQDLAALGAREIGRRQVLDVLEQARADVGDDAGRQPARPSARTRPRRSR